MRFHFLAGLPRAGSTLLASILSQNPRFHASVQSPVGQVVSDMLLGMGPRNESEGFFKGQQRENMLRGAIEGYYAEMQGEIGVAFDSNRRWPANISLLGSLYPGSLILACVRDPRAIVDSFERLFQKNPLDLSVIYGGLSNTTVYERVNEIMKPTGVLGFSLNALRTAYYGPERNRLLIIPYDDLARFPASVMEDLYAALGEELFAHNFEAIEPIPGATEFDRHLRTPGLHDLKKEIAYEPRTSILPIDLLSALPAPFWESKKPETSAG